MSANAKTLRRRFGVICIAVAIVMLIAGETVLKSWLAQSPVRLICYWMGCFILTALAAFAAVVDAARVRQESREEQRALLEDTLRQIEQEKRSPKASKK
ncbi:MAG: hypothetical protein AAB370_04315 [Verrucomicrobiota bacterium]